MALAGFLTASVAYIMDKPALATGAATFGACLAGTALGNYLGTRMGVRQKTEAMPRGRRLALKGLILLLAAVNLAALCVVFRQD